MSGLVWLLYNSVLKVHILARRYQFVFENGLQVKIVFHPWSILDIFDSFSPLCKAFLSSQNP